ncbi:hypothetical protein Hanom_Chr01g00044661 [Helianthus anomalus]
MMMKSEGDRERERESRKERELKREGKPASRHRTPTRSDGGGGESFLVRRFFTG